ncbi:hypothetical protein J9332_45235, partial [Aquimarina celericrescens]|nr:hypothetical protein [Aquimarina celericrescens]
VPSHTEKDINWFQSNYLGSPKDIDFKIKKVKKISDSLEIEILNKTRNSMPVAVYQLKDGRIISKNWVDAFRNDNIIL